MPGRGSRRVVPSVTASIRAVLATLLTSLPSSLAEFYRIDRNDILRCNFSTSVLHFATKIVFLQFFFIIEM